MEDNFADAKGLYSLRLFHTIYMKPLDFVTAYLPFAKETEAKTGISAIAILAQAAVESGWAAHAPNNAFFGVKSTTTLHEKDQLITTTEYSKRSDLKFPEIISIEPTTIHGDKFFKYVVKDWFRKYDTPEESFTDHANFFLTNKRYALALTPAIKNDYNAFIDAISAAGYATSPTYAETLKSVAKTIDNLVKELK